MLIRLLSKSEGTETGMRRPSSRRNIRVQDHGYDRSMLQSRFNDNSYVPLLSYALGTDLHSNFYILSQNNLVYYEALVLPRLLIRGHKLLPACIVLFSLPTVDAGNLAALFIPYMLYIASC